MSKTTLADIARKLGLSQASVSKALSGGGNDNTRISPETMRRVQQAALEMNYRSNAGARALRTRRFHNIGFFDFRRRHTDYSFFDPILNGLSEKAENRGQNIVLVRVPQNTDPTVFPRALREEGLDALIIGNNAMVGPAFQDIIESSGIPIVYLNEKRRTNAVYVNDVLSGRLMTEHLVSRGFTRIAMLAPYTSGRHYSTADRIQGYQEVMREAGLEPNLKTFERQTWREETRNWLSDHAQRPEAIFCANDHIAMLLQRILYDLRLHIPGDIAIAGCNGEQLALHSTIPLTTVKIPFREMGLNAMEMALQCVGQKNKQPIPSIVLEPSLAVHESSLNKAALASLPRLSLYLNALELSNDTTPIDR